MKSAWILSRREAADRARFPKFRIMLKLGTWLPCHLLAFLCGEAAGRAIILKLHIISKKLTFCVINVNVCSCGEAADQAMIPKFNINLKLPIHSMLSTRTCTHVRRGRMPSCDPEATPNHIVFCIHLTPSTCVLVWPNTPGTPEDARSPNMALDVQNAWRHPKMSENA